MIFFCPAIQRIFEGSYTYQDLEDLETAIRCCDEVLKELPTRYVNPKTYLDAVLAIHRVFDVSDPRMAPAILEAENQNPLHQEHGFDLPRIK